MDKSTLLVLHIIQSTQLVRYLFIHYLGNLNIRRRKNSPPSELLRLFLYHTLRILYNQPTAKKVLSNRKKERKKEETRQDGDNDEDDLKERKQSNISRFLSNFISILVR